MSKALRADYDSDPDRFRAGVETVARYGKANDVHPDVAKRFTAEGLSPTLDLGCGEGRLSVNFRPPHRWISFDSSATMLLKAPSPRARGDGTRLPFSDGAFRSVAALWCLYHFPDVAATLKEAHRVLAPGGLFAASASARNSDPEFSHLWTVKGSTFDAEEAAEIVAGVFDGVEVERWDGPLVTLPDEEAVRLFLRGRGLTAGDAYAGAKTVKTPLSLTKRGCLVYGRKT